MCREGNDAIHYRTSIRKRGNSTQEELKSAGKGFKETAREQMNAGTTPQQRKEKVNREGNDQQNSSSTRRCSYDHTGNNL